MRKLFAVFAISAAVTLGGCSKTLQDAHTAFDIITSAKVSPQAVIIAANSFDALEVTATNYLTLKRCSATTGPICRDPGATKAMIPAIRSGRIARNNLLAFLRDHPGELGPRGLYDALESAGRSIQAVMAQYRIGGAQ